MKDKIKLFYTLFSSKKLKYFNFIIATYRGNNITPSIAMWTMMDGNMLNYFIKNRVCFTVKSKDNKIFYYPEGI